jgi:hydrogenase-4 component B
VPAWRSATMGVEGTDSYTAFGYANPTRRVLTSVLHTRTEVRHVANGASAEDGEQVPHVEYTSDVVEVVETYLYRPGLRAFTAVTRVAKRLQSGRLDAYLLYMLIALLAIIALVTALT